MADTKTMSLGDRTFEIPALPLGVCRVVYPVCRKLSLKGALVDRVVSVGLLEAMTDGDMDDLANIDFACAQLADPTFTREEFDQLPVTPIQLFDAFYYVIRYQTGMWIPITPDAEQPAGEAPGEAAPQNSTSIESSAA